MSTLAMQIDRASSLVAGVSLLYARKGGGGAGLVVHRLNQSLVERGLRHADNPDPKRAHISASRQNSLGAEIRKPSRPVFILRQGSELQVARIVLVGCGCQESWDLYSDTHRRDEISSGCRTLTKFLPFVISTRRRKFAWARPLLLIQMPWQN